MTDVILTAFSAQAASQGCMNNFTFGGQGTRVRFSSTTLRCHYFPSLDFHLMISRITKLLPEDVELVRRGTDKVLSKSI